MKRYLKILHAADIQLQITNTGIGRDRYDEYNIGCKRFVNVVAKERPDILVLPGDMFEVHNANGDETKMFSELLHSCIPHCTRIVIIPGNHDLKQRNSLILDKTERRMQVDAIQSTVIAINNSKISYYDKTGFHNDNIFNITWAVWSHKYKFSSTKENPLPYSPYENGNKPDTSAHSNIIELFHDPLAGCPSFDGNEDPVFTDYGITLKSFGSNTIIAGDIHAPLIKWFGEDNKRLFTYSSSLIQRNFGEGNKYNAEKLLINGNIQHGYNIITFDTEEDRATDCVFKILENPVSRHTINIPKDFNYDKVEMLQIVATEFNHIKLSIQGNAQTFLLNEEKIVQHLTNKYACKLHIEYAQNAFDVEVDESLINTVESITDKETILKIADKYITEVVDKTKTISPEHKTQAVAMIKSNLRTELNTVNLLNDKLSFSLCSATISNFMSFANDIEIQFNDVPITKIGGTNGVGKTTIFSFILWMLVDRISEYQTTRNKNYNYSLYFNDTSDSDEVTGELVFNKNNDVHVLKKVLTRTRKRNGDIRGYTMELSLQSNELTSTDTTEILEYISTELFTFDELQRSMFINQKTLTDLIKTSTAELNKTMLQNIGIDFFDGMISRYDELRATQMDKLEKPANTVEELVGTKALNSTEIVIQKESILNLTNAEVVATNIVDTKNNEIETLTRKLHNVDTVDVINDKIKSNKDATNLLIEANNVDNKTIDVLNNKISESNEVSIIAEVNEQKLKVSSTTNGIEITKAEQVSNINIVESAKTNIKNVASIVKSELNSGVSRIEASIVANENNKLQLNNDLATYISKYKTYVDILILEKTSTKQPLEKLIVEYNNSIQKLKDSNNLRSSNNKLTELNIRTNTEKVTTLSNSTNCPTCSRPLSEDKQKEIRCTITTLESDITNYEKTITDNNVLTDTTNTEINSITVGRDTTIAKLQLINTEIEHLHGLKQLPIDSKINNELYTLYDTTKNKLLVSNVTEHTSLVNELNIAKTELVSKVKDDIRVKESLTNYKKLNEHTVVLEGKLQEQQTILKSENEKLYEIKSKLSDVSSLREQQTLLTNKVGERLTNITILETKLKVLNDVIPKAIEDSKTNEMISKQKHYLTTLKQDLVTTSKQLSDAKYILQNLEANEKLYDDKINAARNYKLVDSTLKLYKKLLGTNGLPQYIFAHTIPIINKNLNELLEDVDFRLQFDADDLILRFHDIKKNTKRPVVFISGMEESFASLALIDVMRRLNNSKQIKELFIDEVSGKLNDGKQLTYEAKNYQELLVNFVTKLTVHSNIYIIDHVLSFTKAKHIEVYPTINGSKIRSY